mgnify:CR=1 FL=1
MINYNFCDLSTLLVGQHWYWILFGYQIHGQVIITTWVVILALVFVSLIANLKLKLKDPTQLQNLTEYITEFIRDLAKTQVGESDYLFWTPPSLRQTTSSWPRTEDESRSSESDLHVLSFCKKLY